MTESVPERRTVETFEELVSDVGIELVAVYPCKLMAERADGFDGKLPTEYEIAQDEDVLVALGGERLAVRIVCRFTVKDVCVAEIDYAAEWETRQPVTLSQTALDGLVSRAGVMTLWPFIRQAAQDMILRASNAAITLPMRMVTKETREGGASLTD